ncbi:hypothetical protein LguiA_017151 [Lonicera macranthoides]
MLLLRNRYRKISGKQALMADQSSVKSPTQNQTSPVSSFLGSPRFFNGFLTKGLSDTQSSITPTSILDTKLFSNANPFGYDKNPSKSTTSFSGNKHPSDKLDSEAIGLALIDEKVNEDLSKPNNKMVLFGSKLKIQIPTLSPSGISSPQSPGDFGIKTRNSQFLVTSSPFGSVNFGVQTKKFPPISTGALSLNEIELSEDYTRVISHGPNPRTTHIYDNCIVKSCKKGHNLKSPSPNFLSFCHTCKKNLGQGSDIYMHRGERAFCSEECRCQEIVIDGMKN